MLTLKKHALGGRVVFNLLTSDLQNAREVWHAAEGAVIFGIRIKDYSSREELLDLARGLKQEFGLVSLVLGDGDPSQWQNITELALSINPGHVNQVFPALGYTIGALSTKNIHDQNIVSALVSFSGIMGKVDISTGVLSRNCSEPAVVSIEVALKMIKEVGGKSLKILPFDKEDRLAELKAIIAQTETEKIDIIEPTGGINEDNIGRILSICLKNENSLIVPHIHNAMLDSSGQSTDPKKVENVIKISKKSITHN